MPSARAAVLVVVQLLHAAVFVELEDLLDLLQHGRIWCKRLAAIDTQPAYQTLGDDDPHGARQSGTARRPCEQTGQTGGGVIGVQRAEHQVAGQGGLDGQVGSFAVTDLADHDDVRVLAQQGPQAVGEGHAGTADSPGSGWRRHAVFHRVFDGRDVDVRRVEHSSTR